MEIKIKTSLTEYNGLNEEHISNLIGTLNNNVIEYLDDIINVKIIKNNDELILTRESIDYRLTFNFKSNTCEYLLKDTDTILPIDIKVKYFELNNNSINIKYYIDSNPSVFHFKLEYEVIQ
jgi:hypothetical protein